VALKAYFIKVIIFKVKQ